MALRRPAHLALRQVNGAAFSEPAVLVRTAGHRIATGDNAGRWENDPPTRTDIRVSTRPARDDELDMDPSGERIVGGRVFNCSATLNINALTDEIEYESQTYRVVAVQRWREIAVLVTRRRETGES